MLRAQGAFMDPSVIKENTVQGIAASQGIAYGQVFVYIQSDVEVPSYQVEPEHRIEEVARFDKALLVTRQQIAKIHAGNQLVIAHGNGPQVGLLSLQAAAYTSVSPYPLDVLGAETEGMIGYIIEQELGNLLDFEVPFATLLTQVEVDANDPAFKNPTKPIGPVYSKADAEKLAAEKGWAIAPDGDKYRRVVASPKPKRIFEIRPIKWLLEKRMEKELIPIPTEINTKVIGKTI